MRQGIFLWKTRRRLLLPVKRRIHLQISYHPPGTNVHMYCWYITTPFLSTTIPYILSCQFLIPLHFEFNMPHGVLFLSTHWVFVDRVGWGGICWWKEVYVLPSLPQSHPVIISVFEHCNLSSSMLNIYRSNLGSPHCGC